MYLPIVLIVSFLQFPSMPPVHVERFESEAECRAAAVVLDKSTKVILTLQCFEDES